MSMHKRCSGNTVIPAAVLLIALAVAGCGSDEPVAEDSPSSSATSGSKKKPEATKSTAVPKPSEPAHRGRLLTTSPSDYGTILFDGTGQAIYLFEKETTDRPDCYQACATAWPPVLTQGAPRVGGEAVADLVDTTVRTDGSMQVTYGGHPLYYYVHDGKNEVLCHNVTEFGGLWLVVTPTGDAAA